MTNALAPILLIGFNRPIHFRKTLLALSKNTKAKDSILYISIDGPRNKNEVRLQEAIFKNIQLADGFFAKINILRNNTNKGLAKNIIESISKVLSNHNQIIVLEDDIVTSRAFLAFMNDALYYYKNKKNIWQINGYSPINNLNKKNNIYFSKVSHCWGWATWSDRWEKFNKNPKSIIQEFDKKMIYQFNLDGEVNFWDQIIENKIGKINTWSIFWYASVFINNGLCVYPWFSYVKNIGFDGSGTNCNQLNSKMTNDIINDDGKFISNDKLIEDKEALELLKKTNNRNLMKSYLVKILNNLLGYNFSYKIKTFLKEF